MWMNWTNAHYMLTKNRIMQSGKKGRKLYACAICRQQYQLFCDTVHASDMRAWNCKSSSAAISICCTQCHPRSCWLFDHLPSNKHWTFDFITLLQHRGSHFASNQYLHIAHRIVYTRKWKSECVFMWMKLENVRLARLRGIYIRREENKKNVWADTHQPRWTEMMSRHRNLHDKCMHE